MRSLGLDTSLHYVDFGDLYEVRHAMIGPPLTVPHGAEAALAAIVRRFPQYETGLKWYFQRIMTLHGAAAFAAHHQDDGLWWLTHAPEAIRTLWPVLRDGRATLGDVLRELFGTHEAVKLALAANLIYYHDDPDKMVFKRFAVAQASYRLGGWALCSRWLASAQRQYGGADHDSGRCR